MTEVSKDQEAKINQRGMEIMIYRRQRWGGWNVFEETKVDRRVFWTYAYVVLTFKQYELFTYYRIQLNEDKRV